MGSGHDGQAADGVNELVLTRLWSSDTVGAVSGLALAVVGGSTERRSGHFEVSGNNFWCRKVRYARRAPTAISQSPMKGAGWRAWAFGFQLTGLRDKGRRTSDDSRLHASPFPGTNQSKSPTAVHVEDVVISCDMKLNHQIINSPRTVSYSAVLVVST